MRSMMLVVALVLAGCASPPVPPSTTDSTPSPGPLAVEYLCQPQQTPAAPFKVCAAQDNFPLGGGQMLKVINDPFDNQTFVGLLYLNNWTQAANGKLADGTHTLSTVLVVTHDLGETWVQADIPYSLGAAQTAAPNHDWLVRDLAFDSRGVLHVVGSAVQGSQFLVDWFYFYVPGDTGESTFFHVATSNFGMTWTATSALHTGGGEPATLHVGTLADTVLITWLDYDAPRLSARESDDWGETWKEIEGVECNGEPSDMQQVQDSLVFACEETNAYAWRKDAGFTKIGSPDLTSGGFLAGGLASGGDGKLALWNDGANGAEVRMSTDSGTGWYRLNLQDSCAACAGTDLTGVAGGEFDAEGRLHLLVVGDYTDSVCPVCSSFKVIHAVYDPIAGDILTSSVLFDLGNYTENPGYQTGAIGTLTTFDGLAISGSQGVAMIGYGHVGTVRFKLDVSEP